MEIIESNLMLVRKAYLDNKSQSKFASSEVVIERLVKLSSSLSPSLQSKLRPLLVSAKVMSQPLSLRRDYGDKESNKWKDKPAGWTNESRKSFWVSLTGDNKHKVTVCMEKMQGKVSNPGAFCAALRDRVEGKSWRQGERKSRSEEAADIEPTKRSEWPDIPEGNKAAGCGCGCGGNCPGCSCDTSREVRAIVRVFARNHPKLASMVLETLWA